MGKETILITGGTGYIGSKLAKKLVKNKFNVILLDAKPVLERVSDIIKHIRII